eukprot:1148812-Pelagomonas_calceolata.AAC.6
MSGTEHKGYTNTEEGRSERSYLLKHVAGPHLLLRGRRGSILGLESGCRFQRLSSGHEMSAFIGRSKQEDAALLMSPLCQNLMQLPAALLDISCYESRLTPRQSWQREKPSAMAEGCVGGSQC